MKPKYFNLNVHSYFIDRIVVLSLLLFFIPDGLFGKKKPFIGKDRYNRQISEGIENNGDTLSVTYVAFHPFQIDTTKMAINKIAGRLTKQEIDIFKNFADVYKFADEGPKEELYVVQGSQIDSIFYDGLFGFKKVVIPSDANKKFSHYYEKGLKEGEWTEWFVDESPREIYHYKKDLLDGSYAIFDSASGQKIIEKMYKKDVLNGQWKEWYLDNTLKLEYSYKNDNRHGISIDYDSTGKKDSEKMYKDGLKDGEWNFYNDDVVLVRVEIYNDDLKDGLWYTKDLDTRDIHYEEYREDKFIVRYTEHYYPNFQLMEKYAYKDSLPHGKWIGYHKDGETKHVKRFEDGKKQGKWQYYTELGDIHTLELFENDKRNGEWYKKADGKDVNYQFWDMDSLISEYADLHYPNGQLKEKISYKEGLKDGKFTGYYQNGAKKYVKRYEQDLPAGKWQYYTMAGKTNAEEIYVEGKRNDEWYRLEENGDVYYQFWDMDSLISEYADLHYPNGQLIEKISYKEGRKNGKFTGYYESGQTKYIRTYKDDKLEGKYADYTESGQILLKQSYANDLLDGASKEWYLNGEVKVKSSYTAGKLNGGFMSYDSLGRKETKGEYDMGLKTGDWLTWYPSGKKKERLSYFSGKANGMYSLWDEEGRIIKEGEYSNDLKHGVWITFDPDLKRQESYEYYDMGVAKLKYFFKYYDNGNLMEEPSFTEYFRDGEWKQLFDNERLQYLTTYSMGKKYGLYEEWTIKKELVQRGYYEYDLMSALWTYAKNDSVIKYEVYDADSIIDGFVYEYYDNDQSKADAVFLENGKRDQKWYTYFEEGKDSTISVYDGGKKTGAWYVHFDSTFEISTETNYENNLKHGDYKEWYIDENPMVEGYYEYGKKHLLWAFWDEKGYQRFEEWRMGELYDTFEYEYYENGQLKEEPSYKNRKKHGQWFRYFPDGEISGVREFVNGKRAGEWVDYYRKDEIAFQGVYRDDKNDGPWIWYYMNRGEPGEEGNIMSEVKFNNGELISEKCYKREDSEEINCQEIFGENDYRFADKK